MILALVSVPAHATVYPLPVPDWVLPALEAAPDHSPEKVALSLWILGWPCPELDDSFAPRLTPVYTPPPIWMPPEPGPPPAAVPELSTWLLMLIGFASMILGRRFSCAVLS